MINLLKKNIRQILILLLIMFGAIATELYFLTSLSDTLKKLPDTSGLPFLLISFLLKIILQFFLAYQQPNTAFIILESISKNVLFSILKSNKINTLPDTIRLSTIESDHVVMGMILPIIVLSVEICTLVAVTYFLFSEINFQVLALIIFSSSLMLAVFILISKLQLKLGMARLENDRSRIKAIRNLHTLNHELKYIGNRNWFIDHFRSKLSNVVKSAKISNFFQQIPRQIIEIFGLLLIGVMYVNLSSSGKTSDEINVFFAVFIAGALRIIPSITKILTSIQSIIYTTPSYCKINEILIGVKNYDETLLPTCVLSESETEIFVDYSTAKADIKDVRYKLLKNRLNIIVGESGVGKTTLLHSMCDSASVSNISTLKGRLNPVSLLTQESSVIEGSFSENIFLYDSDYKDLIESSQDYVNLINLLRLKDIADRFEFVEHIQEGGANISGGEARRICLARHLLKKPSILFLDEPTVGLSQKAEIEIFELLKDLCSNVTIVAVTHSNIAADFADHIIRLSNEQ